jgi:hypothetical protein
VTDLELSFRLRMTKPERAEVEAVQAEGKAAGLAPSLNDAIRHLIRRPSLPPAYSLAEARDASMAHHRVCDRCGPLRPAQCLDGLYLFRRQLEFRRRQEPPAGE